MAFNRRNEEIEEALKNWIPRNINHKWPPEETGVIVSKDDYDELAGQVQDLQAENKRLRGEVEAVLSFMVSVIDEIIRPGRTQEDMTNDLYRLKNYFEGENNGIQTTKNTI